MFSMIYIQKATFKTKNTQRCPNFDITNGFENSCLNNIRIFNIITQIYILYSLITMPCVDIIALVDSKTKINKDIKI